MTTDTTPETIAIRLVGAGDAALLVEVRRLVALGIREDRRGRALHEGAREVLREVLHSFLKRAAEEGARAEEAGFRHDGEEASDASDQQEALLAAAGAVSEAIEAMAAGAVRAGEKTISVAGVEFRRWPHPVAVEPRVIFAAGPGLWQVIGVSSHDVVTDSYRVIVIPRQPL